MSRPASGGAVFISSVLSEKYGLLTGDRLRLRTLGGPQDFEIAAVVVDFFNQGLLFGALLTRIFLWGMTAMAGYNLTFTLSSRAVGMGLLLALVISQLAAVFPARRAAGLRILEAIQFE